MQYFYVARSPNGNFVAMLTLDEIRAELSTGMLKAGFYATESDGRSFNDFKSSAHGPGARWRTLAQLLIDSASGAARETTGMKPGAADSIYELDTMMPSAPVPRFEMPYETKVCPFCAETIKSAAVVCRFCGRDLNNINVARERPSVMKHGFVDELGRMAARKFAGPMVFFAIFILMAVIACIGALMGTLKK